MWQQQRKNINGNDIELWFQLRHRVLLAAVENGADAIYAGGQLLRAGAQNFNDDELKQHQIMPGVYVQGLRYYEFCYDDEFNQR